MARTRRKFRLGVESLERRLVPAHFLVTSLADQGPGSLRSAIAAANASPGADSITFEPPVSATASLSGLTIIRSFGYSAGALNSKTSLAINDCVFAERLGGYGAIGLSPSTGKLTVAGGAVALDGPVTIQSCVFTGNVTDSSNVKAPGGAVSSLLGSMTIADSGFASNSTGWGGAVAAFDFLQFRLRFLQSV